MAMFELQTPDGQSYEVEAPDEGSALKALEGMGGAQKPPPPVNTDGPVMGPLKQFAVGAGKGLLGLAELPGTLRDLTQRGTIWAAGKMGATPEQQEAMGKANEGLKHLPFPLSMAAGPMAGAPGPGDLRREIEKTTGPFREPQNMGEQVADTAGELAPAMIGPGGPLPKIASWAGATAGAEGGKVIAEKTGVDPAYGEVVGTLAGGLTSLTAAEKLIAQSGKKLAQKSVPSASQIKETSQAAYKAADDVGLTLKPEGYGKILDDIYHEVGDDFFAANHPKLANAFAEAEKWRDSPITLGKLDALRKKIKSAYSSGDPEQNMVMQKALDKLDDAVENLTPDMVSSGDPAAASLLLKSARSNWSKFRKAELFDNITQNAKNALGANYTEAGFQTAVRQQLRAIAKDDFKRFKYLRPAERTAILETINGGKFENFARGLGKYSVLSSTGGLKAGGAALLANFIGGPTAAAVVGGGLGTLGTIAKPIGSAIGKGKLKDLNAMIRAGAPVQGPRLPSIANSNIPFQGLLDFQQSGAGQ